MNLNIHIVSLLILVGLVQCQSPATLTDEEKNKEPISPSTEIVLSQEQIQAIGLTYGKLETKNMGQSIRANGRVDVPPSHHAQVNAKAEGFVRTVQVLPGHFVRAGQSLLVLENSEYVHLQEQYLIAQQELAYIEQTYQRQNKLRQESINARKELQRAEADLAIKKAQKISLEQRLSFLGFSPASIQAESMSSLISVTSPIDGYVKAVSARMGAFVNQGSPLIEIIGTDHKHLELQVFEKDILQVQEGQKVHFSVPNLKDKTYPATVFLVGKSFEQATKTVQVHAHIEDKAIEQKLLPGMFVEAELELANQALLSLPEQAIVPEGALFYIFWKAKEKGDKIFFQKREVIPQNTKNGFTAVRFIKPLPTSAQVVKEKAYYLQALLHQEGKEE